MRKTFSYAQRLSRAVEIEAVKKMGKRIRTGHLDVWVAVSPFSRARVGIVVPRYKHSAVDRNKLRRQLRELVRVQMLPIIPVYDVLIRSLPHAYEAAFDVLAIEIDRIAKRV